MIAAEQTIVSTPDSKPSEGETIIIPDIMSQPQPQEEKKVKVKAKAPRRRRSKKTPRAVVFERKPCSSEVLITNALAGAHLGGGDATPALEASRFEDMGLSPDLMKGILAYGWEKPAQIQQKGIMPLIQGHDLVLQAQSGMGKTAALCIGILQKLDLKDRVNCQAFVVVPTRELAKQVTQVFRDLGRFMKIKCASVTGGSRTKPDKEKLTKGGYSVVVGTLGRTRNLMQGKHFSTDAIRMFAVDEADQMITDPSFRNDLAFILKNYIPGNAQVIVMSATMPEVAMNRTKEFMKNPKYFLLKNDELTLEGIRQYHINVEDEGKKMDTLFDLKEVFAADHTMVFVNYCSKVGKITKEFKKRMTQNANGDKEKIVKISSIRGTNYQEERNKSLKNFRTGESRLLITTDLLGRGIDMQHVKYVINYDLPDKTEEYIHRVGRGGRYGRTGIAITLITSTEVDKLKQIADFYNTEIGPMPANIFQTDITN